MMKDFYLILWMILKKSKYPVKPLRGIRESRRVGFYNT